MIFNKFWVIIPIIQSSPPGPTVDPSHKKSEFDSSSLLLSIWVRTLLLFSLAIDDDVLPHIAYRTSDDVKWY